MLKLLAHLMSLKILLSYIIAHLNHPITQRLINWITMFNYYFLIPSFFFPLKTIGTDLHYIYLSVLWTEKWMIVSSWCNIMSQYVYFMTFFITTATSFFFPPLMNRGQHTGCKVNLTINKYSYSSHTFFTLNLNILLSHLLFLIFIYLYKLNYSQLWISIIIVSWSIFCLTKSLSFLSTKAPKTTLISSSNYTLY